MTILSSNYAKPFGSSAYLAKLKAQSAALRQTDQIGKFAVPAQTSAASQSSIAAASSFKPVTAPPMVVAPLISSTPPSATRTDPTSTQHTPSQSGLTQISVASTQSETTPSNTTQTDVASRFGTPYIDAAGRFVIPVSLPSLPDMPELPVRTIDLTTRVIDPATGTYAPIGYESQAQFDEHTATIVARSRAMYRYFQEINTIIDHAHSIIATNPTSNPSETTPQNQ